MFKSLLAITALATVSAAAHAQTTNARPWKLEVAPTGCVVHAAAASGTVVSIWGMAGESSLRFLVQNKSWNSFSEGQNYDIQVSFDGRRAFPMKAVARQNIDSDGPGLTFTVNPQPAGGTSFVEQFATSGGMNISRGGQAIEAIQLADTQVAMRGLAQCLSQVWAAGGGAAEPKEEANAKLTTI
jgi:hypothetical protein